MAIRLSLSNIAEWNEASACLEYETGDPARLADLVRNNQITQDSTRAFIAGIIDGTGGKKRRGRKPDPEAKTAVRNMLIRRDYDAHKMLAQVSILFEQLGYAIEKGLYPRGTSLPLLNDEGRPIRFPTPKGWKNTSGSVKDRALRAVGKKYCKSPERISEIVYPRKGEG